jgi:alcohol dehydrogenase (cytochrome c)
VEVRSRSPIGGAQGVACCDLVNRGARLRRRPLFFNTLDTRPSRSTRDRRELWRTQLGDITAARR